MRYKLPPILLLTALQACTPSPDTSGAPPAPGTMRMLSVEPVEDPAAASLLPNGAFEEWYGGLPAPTGFRAPAPASESTLMRDAKSGHLGSPGYTARQTWNGPGAGAAPSESFHTTVDLAPETRYELDVIAAASPGMRAGIGAYEVDAEGRTRVLARCIVEVSGEKPARYTGVFDSGRGGPTLIASHALGGGAFPGSVIWSAWRLRKSVGEFAPLNIADAPARRALVNNALDQVRGQVALYGGAGAWREAMAPNLDMVDRIFRGGISKGESIPGYEGFVFDKASVAWYRDTARAAEGDTGAPPPGVAAILRAERALNARGAHLIAVPVPERVDLYFDKLIPPDSPAPVYFAPHTLLVETLLSHDVIAVDAAPALLDIKAKGIPLYWRTNPDTPSATLHAIADLTAPLVEGLAPALDEPRTSYTIKVDTVPLDSRLLPGLAPKYQRTADPEIHEVQSVREDNGALFTPAPSGPVLAAGSLAVLHQVRGGSFAARLSMALGRPVALPRVNLPDTEVPAWIAAGEAPELAAAKVVVFCFPEQALAHEGWK